ncbi:shikimate kinase [Friedmanniella endophytica]|uniref:Shikimate kinase n=1 Tax=Microlunatus kandeliicorticis TaxID=1759536 RepID=A0A7W3IU07_9ACTN|nr:AAA family ATPase [Microlunatus kandeliicorticis]MBA8795219.1 shikimate kinase [Microlunatus kandeliicorticis]
MARILITGMSGAGKSTLLAELAARGRTTVETDVDGWEVRRGLWDEPRMHALLDREPDVVVCGTVENQGRFADRFDHVVLLSAPLDVLLGRVATRPTNPYGRTGAEREEIVRHHRGVEPLLRAAADLELDGRRPVAELADRIEALLDGR